MGYCGEITQIAREFEGGILVTMKLGDVPVEELRKLKNMGKLAVTIKKFRQKRSLDANAYYWELLTKLAEAIRISKPMAHNMMLRRYGQRFTIDGQLVQILIPDTEQAEREALQAETYHIKPTSHTKEAKDGKRYRSYVMLKGSSCYNTQEMSELIEGLISECREQNIETLPPAELERLLGLYEKRNFNRI